MSTEKINLLDLIDLEFLQKFQDVFAKATGVASIMVDNNGPITKPSNFTEFCIKYTRGSEEGVRRCNNCDISWGKVAAEKGKPVIYKCHTGLTDFAVPIVVNGEHVASILGGQILTSEPDLNHFKQVAKDLGINENEYIEAVKKIKIVPPENVDAAAELLFVVANAISKLAHRKMALFNLHKSEKTILEREVLLRKLTETIRKSLDIKETKELIVNIIGKTFDADRCFLIDYDDSADVFLPVEYEYLSSIEVPPYKGTDVNIDVPNFMDELKKGNSLVVDNKTIYINGVLQDYELEQNAIEKFGVYSAYGFPLFYKKQLKGVLGMHYLNHKRLVSNDEIKFLNVVANQISIALYQAELFDMTQKNAQREMLLRTVISSLRSSLDLKEVKTTITRELGTIFDADRCYFRSYDKEQSKFLAPDVEYLGSKDIGSLLNVEPDQEGLKFFSDEVEKQKKGFYPIVVDKKIAKGTPLETYFKSAGICVDYAIPIIDRQDELTWLVLHYAKKDPKLSEEDKKMLETIAYQIDIAFEQIKLYNNVKNVAKREALLRNIIEKIRISLDIEEILAYICEETTKLFKVQRAAIAVYPDMKKYTTYTLRKEYRVTEDVKSFTDIKYCESILKYWEEALANKGVVLAIDNLRDSNTPEYFKEAYDSVGIKSLIGTSIHKGENIWGTLVLSEYYENKHWTDDDKLLLKAIADQVYIAINQAELYEKEKIAAEREKVSRNIIEILRSTMDKNVIKRLFVKNIGKFFNADRVFMAEYDSKAKMYLPVDENSEYLSSNNEKSFIGYDWSDTKNIEYISILLEKREFNIKNWKEYIKQNPDKGQDFIDLFKNANVQSSYNFPILYEGNIMGFFCIEFTQKLSEFTDEDIARIRSICTQAGIALYHAELYAKAQQQSFSKSSFISKVSENIKKPVSQILETSTFLSENELERPEQINYLNSIIVSCNHLLELTENFKEEGIE